MVRVDRIPDTVNDGSISAALYQFFAAYFHQDWDLEADDWEGIVDGYAADHPAAQQHIRIPHHQACSEHRRLQKSRQA